MGAADPGRKACAQNDVKNVCADDGAKNACRNVPPRGASRSYRYKALPAVSASEMLLIRIAPGDTGLFRYLLEGASHTAMLTVLDPKAALFKLLYSPHQRGELLALLDSIRQTVPFDVQEWPFGPAAKGRAKDPAGREGGSL